MPTPLDSFIETLQKRHKMQGERSDDSFSRPDCSLPAHTHTSGTLSNEDAKMECETKCEGPLTLPEPPLQPGWLVAYRDRRGVLSGGCDDRQHGTVAECRWEENRWMVHLTDEQRLPLSFIRSVGQTNKAGEIVAAWTVREHGYDGHGTERKGIGLQPGESWRPSAADSQRRTLGSP